MGAADFYGWTDWGLYWVDAERRQTMKVAMELLRLHLLLPKGEGFQKEVTS